MHHTEVAGGDRKPQIGHTRLTCPSDVSSCDRRLVGPRRTDEWFWPMPRKKMTFAKPSAARMTYRSPLLPSRADEVGALGVFPGVIMPECDECIFPVIVINFETVR